MPISTLVNPFFFGGAAPAAIGSWKEVKRATLGAAATSITASSIPQKLYYWVLFHAIGSTSPATAWRFNSDTGTNYARRQSVNGAADTTSTSQTFISTSNSNVATTAFQTLYITNLLNQEKGGTWHNIYQNSAGSSSVPTRDESIGKWANTTSVIDSMTVTSTSTPEFASGTEMVVLGWDPSDSHPTNDNFWSELVNFTLGSNGDLIDTSTIATKKYLYFEASLLATGGNIVGQLQFNSDTTASNYASRFNENNGGENTEAGTNGRIVTFNASSANPGYLCGFIVNVSSREKLAMGHTVWRNSTGGANVTSRVEWVGKWVNTSNAITSIQLRNNSTGDFLTGSTLKVWGAD